jgi:hypothetical protein
VWIISWDDVISNIIIIRDHSLTPVLHVVPVLPVNVSKVVALLFQQQKLIYVEVSAAFFAPCDERLLQRARNPTGGTTPLQVLVPREKSTTSWHQLEPDCISYTRDVSANVRACSLQISL